jgi:membrane-bound lytic murein transglycosylase D
MNVEQLTAYAKEHSINATLPSFSIITDTIRVRAYYHFQQIASILNLPVEELRQLNPQYKNDIIPAKDDKPYTLKLPQEKVTAFIEQQNQIFAFNRDKYFPNNELIIPNDNAPLLALDGKKKIFYTVKKGENTAIIAKKNHVTVSNLVKWNNLRHSRVHVGQQLAIYIPDKKGVQNKQAVANANSTNEKTLANMSDTIREVKKEPAKVVSAEGDFTYYTVRSGDSLYTIAKQFSGVSHKDIIALNQIKDTRGLVPGQKLKIPVK